MGLGLIELAVATLRAPGVYTGIYRTADARSRRETFSFEARQTIVVAYIQAYRTYVRTYVYIRTYVRIFGRNFGSDTIPASLSCVLEDLVQYCVPRMKKTRTQDTRVGELNNARYDTSKYAYMYSTAIIVHHIWLLQG